MGDQDLDGLLSGKENEAGCEANLEGSPLSDDQDPDPSKEGQDLDPSIEDAEEEVSSEFNEPADAPLIIRDISWVLKICALSPQPYTPQGATWLS